MDDDFPNPRNPTFLIMATPRPFGRYKPNLLRDRDNG